VEGYIHILQKYKSLNLEKQQVDVWNKVRTKIINEKKNIIKFSFIKKLEVKNAESIRRSILKKYIEELKDSWKLFLMGLNLKWEEKASYPKNLPRESRLKKIKKVNFDFFKWKYWVSKFVFPNRNKTKISKIQNTFNFNYLKQINFMRGHWSPKWYNQFKKMNERIVELKGDSKIQKNTENETTNWKFIITKKEKKYENKLKKRSV